MGRRLGQRASTAYKSLEGLIAAEIADSHRSIRRIASLMNRCRRIFVECSRTIQEVLSDPQESPNHEVRVRNLREDARSLVESHRRAAGQLNVACAHLMKLKEMKRTLEGMAASSS